MDKSRVITVDNYQITPKLIDRAFKKARQQNKTKEVLAETFRLLNLNKLYQTNPSDSSIKQAIKAIVDSQFLSNANEYTQKRVEFDLSQVFLLNKLGNFGRTLQRKCRLIKNGVMEFEDEKQQPKFKQIKRFVNKIQTIGDSQNDAKIGWHSEQKKYPFRIILVDKSDGHRGIYFDTKQKAQKIRLMLTQTYLYQGDFPKLISKLADNFQLQVNQKFKNKLVSRAKMLNASTRFSRKITFQPSKNFQQAPAPVVKNEQNTSIFNKSNRKNEEMGQKQRRDEMLIIPGIISTQQQDDVEQSFQKINGFYLNNFFKVWQNKAQVRAIQLQNEKQPSVGIEIEDDNRLIHSKINENSKKQKTQRFNDLFSKKKLDISNLSVSRGRKQLEVGDLGQSSLKDRNKSLKNSVLKGEQSFIKEIDRQLYSDYDQICFYKIAFLSMKNLFFKPIVTIELVRKNITERSALYNTIIVKKQPELVYELLRDKQDDPLVFNSNIRQFQINVRVIDFLSNEELISDKISLKNRTLSTKTWMQGENKLIQLQLGMQKSVKQQQLKKQQHEDTFSKVELQIPPLNEATREKINQFWQKELQSQGYYNETDLSIYNILSHAECVPLTWWKDVSQEEYELLHIIYIASKILGFKMLRSFSHIIKIFTKIYSDLQVLTQKLLSFVQTFLKVYYFPQCLNKIQKFHKLIGLDQDCQFISKINLEMMVIKKIIELQCPILVDKLKRKNIAYGYVIMQYIYQAFSRNFTLSNLKDLWNFLYKDLQYLQLNMALISVFLIKHHEQDLLKVKRLKEFSRILQSKKVTKIATIINQIDSYKQKYFGKAKGFIDQIKNIFNAQPLEPIIQQFYKRQTSKMDKRKKTKLLQKKSSLRKVNRQIDLQFPEYQCKKYTLHILFTKIPQVGGSLTLKCADIEYQCLNHQKKRYFIISQVSSAVYLHFLDLKSNQFSCELIFNQGIHENSCFLTSEKLVKSYKVQYIAGLLTDNQIQILKKGKKFEHFVSPFVKQTQMLQQMNRPLSQTYFLRKYDSYNSKQDLVKKIKALFCSGNKLFNEIEFYLEQIETSDLTIEQKFYFTKMLAKQFSQEFCLCNNHILQKHFIRHFLESTGYELTPHQFECFYSDSFEYEFDAPKILKCRFYPINQLNKEIKLELAALEYFVNKSITYMYSDIIVDDLVQAVTSSINEQLGGLVEGDLKLYYSSASQIFMKSWHLKVKNKNKQFSYEEIMEDIGREVQEDEMEEPELLMTEILPSFAKISTILDYVNSNRTVDLKSKYQDKDRKKIAEQINILKESRLKFKKILMMRHLKPPEKLYFPFFNYYYELTKDLSTPNVKTIFFNNLKSDLKAICLFKGNLKFGQNAKVQSYTYNNDIGLYGNLRMISKDAKGWFFFGLTKDEHQNLKTNARIFVNYGYGIFRWQNCIVLGYVLRKKQVKTPKSSNETKLKKQYLVRVRNQEKYVKDYELDISSEALSKIQKISDQFQKSQKYERKNIDDNQQERKSSQLKYLTKFMK